MGKHYSVVAIKAAVVGLHMAAAPRTGEAGRDGGGLRALRVCGGERAAPLGEWFPVPYPREQVLFTLG